MADQNILYLEDQPCYSEPLLRQLNELGYNTTHVTTFHEAIAEKIHFNTTYSHFIFDVNVPWNNETSTITKPHAGLLALDDIESQYEMDGRTLPKIALCSSYVDEPDTIPSHMATWKRKGAIYIPKEPSHKQLEEFLNT